MDLQTITIFGTSPYHTKSFTDHKVIERSTKSILISTGNIKVSGPYTIVYAVL